MFGGAVIHLRLHVDCPHDFNRQVNDLGAAMRKVEIRLLTPPRPQKIYNVFYRLGSCI